MKLIDTNISGCYLIASNSFQDSRGTFCEIFKHSLLDNFLFEQINYSFSHRNVLRGIHQAPFRKLVTCVFGEIFDVCIDLRHNSPTYLQYYSYILNSKNIYSIIIPKDCGHGFLALSDAVVVYNQEGQYKSELDKTFCYDAFNINWPIMDQSKLILSTKDRNSCT